LEGERRGDWDGEGLFTWMVKELLSPFTNFYKTPEQEVTFWKFHLLLLF
jgi:hypothetical protein